MGTPKLNPGMPSTASLSGSSAIAHLPPHPFPAVAVVPPSVAVVGQRVCATAPVAEADYSLQKSNGAAGERYSGGGRGEGGGGVGGTAAPHNCSCFASAVPSVAPAATSAALHFSAAADAAGPTRKSGTKYQVSDRES